MPTPIQRLFARLESAARHVMRALDAPVQRVYGWRWNPLHQSGTIAAWLLLVLAATGLYLILFYRVGAPSASVQRIAADPWLGAWVRTLHRYATDAFVVAAAIHAVRLFGQARAWGPRTRAWLTGIFLVGVGLACAWTGFVMAWDSFGLRLAVGGARLIDALPVLSEPLQRMFLGATQPPPAFFFINLFIHIALPLAMGILLWLHVSRVARPVLLPPRALRWRITAVLVVAAVLMPAPLGEAARPLIRPGHTPLNIMTAWWLPLAERTPPSAMWGFVLLTVGGALAVPFFGRRPRTQSWAPSVVDPRLCTGCDQCTQDCPWEAITMVPRTDDRPTLVALVDPTKCVSCGICAGSCAPMGVGPPGRTGRDQLAALDAIASLQAVTAAAGQLNSAPDRRVVVLVCAQAPAEGRRLLVAAGARVQETPCVGNVHTSVIERLLRRGAPGVMIAGCPPRDCVGREGPKWLEQRLYHDREAELQPRVDRRRVRIVTLAAGVEREALVEFDAFRHEVRALGDLATNSDAELEAVCETASPMEE